MLSIKSQIKAYLATIADCAEQVERPADEIQLMAVSKTRTVDEIQQALAAGCRHFGESYVQEAIAKIQAINDDTVTWHFIGPIQSNKTQLIAQYFQWVHSIDRDKIARRLNDQRPAGAPALNVCIQVNISDEPSKSGVTMEDIEDLVNNICQLPRLCLRGLMAIPQRTDVNDEQAQRQAFKQLHDEMQRLNQQGYELDTLSMGMTDDLCAAVKEGSTIVRVGTGIFGARDQVR